MRPVVLAAALICSLCLTAQSPCATEGHDGFDFWIGEWDVYDYSGDTLVGRNSIAKILGNCVLEESWTGLGGSVGKSFNTYDARAGEWTQLWVDNFGSRLEFRGRRAGDVLEMRGELPRRDGGADPCILRYTWDREKDEVRQEWLRSADGGQTWKSIFDGRYRKRG